MVTPGYVPSTGKRAGVGGRLPKPSLTEEEFLAIVPILAKPRGKWGGSRKVAADKVAEMRGVHKVIDERSKASRRVSETWIGYELKRLGIAGKTDLQKKLEDGSLETPSGKNYLEVCDTGSPVSKPGTLPESSGVVAGVQESKQQAPVGIEEVAAGGKA